MKLKCRHCLYEWEYEGKHEYWATCPRCLYKVNLTKKDNDGQQT